ncbi:MAG TPA: uroporphyrinogen-III synthase [Bryobacteraceae bacterium]|nr:uroporphyrinogen-III synthase [Bryobacteraceae bacterium]
MAFDGLRVISFESRRAGEIGELIRRNGGEPFVAPSMREVPLDRNDEAFAFGDRLLRGDFDMMIFLTGVGTRLLRQTLATRWAEDTFIDALRMLTVVARGPKPAAVLREMNVPIAVQVPEPNTWRELLKATESRPERRIAVQEYGKSNLEMLNALRARKAEVTTVRIYQWDLPEDLAPLREAIRRIGSGARSAVLFTTSVQVVHLFKVAEQDGLAGSVREGLERMAVASIGPTTSEALEEYGISPDLEPSHPKMGILVKETAERWRDLLARKRAGHA